MDLSYTSFEPDELLKRANYEIEQQWKTGHAVSPEALMRLPIFLSLVNIRKKEGGPFGAIIVAFEDGFNEQGEPSGKPEIIGMGANHVQNLSDPSAHAEMEAIRDAAKRREYSELSDAIMLTSCECCPMCLTATHGVGIQKIYYTATRDDASAVGFSDKKQYDLMVQELATYATPIGALEELEQKRLEKLMEEKYALIVNHKYDVIAEGLPEFKEEEDPTATASMQAIRKACTITGKPHLPEEYTLISRHIPHPAAMVAADWARLGRKRDAAHPTSPAHDGEQKDPSKILFFEHAIEPIFVTNKEAGTRLLHNPAESYIQPGLPIDKRSIKMQQLNTPSLRRAALKAFAGWKKYIDAAEQEPY
jgi:guanine deaminase